MPVFSNGVAERRLADTSGNISKPKSDPALTIIAPCRPGSPIDDEAG